MAQSPGVEIVGLDRLARTLATASDGLGDLKAAVSDASDIVAAEARSRVPRRSGRLAASIVIGSERNTAMVGSDLVYAAPIHWGWRARGIVGSLFLSEAAADTEPVWTRAFADDVERTLAKVKGA